MNRTTLPSIVLILVLSGCTRTTASEPTPTSAPTVAPGINSSDCTDRAEFVSDVSVEDGTNFDQGAAIKKIWRIKNTGTCTWTKAYSLVFVDGDQMGTPDSTLLSNAKPGEMLDITVNMFAPDTDAVYRADFEIHDPAGKAIPIDKGTKLWVIITVGKATYDSGSESGAASGGTGFASVSCAFTTNQTNIDAVVSAINAYRAKNGLPAFTVNEKLTDAAQAHSNDMACNNLFVHTGSNGSTAESRASAAGYSGAVTENVYGRNPAPTGQEAVTWWATDPSDSSHNENLLSTNYIEIGVGYSFFDSFGYYAVVFGAP